MPLAPNGGQSGASPPGAAPSDRPWHHFGLRLAPDLAGHPRVPLCWGSSSVRRGPPDGVLAFVRKNAMQILDLLTGLLQVATAAVGLYAAIALARRQLARRVEREPAEPPSLGSPATAPSPVQRPSVPPSMPGSPLEASAVSPEADVRS